MTLQELGWNDFFASHFAPHEAEGRVPARVTLQLKGHFEVTGEFGAKLGECTGHFLHHATRQPALPAIGDWAAVTPRDEHRADIHALLPRRTTFSRQAVSEDLQQVVAANVDTVFLVSALDADYSLHRIERYLAAAWASGAQPVILLNKADLCPDPTVKLHEVRSISSGAPVQVLSARTRRGIKDLAPWLLPGKTIAFLGSSGVGKSTLINRLVGEQLQDTQEVREYDGKGRHTTTQRELIVTPGRYIVIDTPGMRELQPWDAAAGVAVAFADVAEIAARCKFRDCSHSVEPGCAVLAALGAGTLDSTRWESYGRLLRATAHEVRRVDKRAALQTKSEFKKLTKSLRQRIREKSGEE